MNPLVSIIIPVFQVEDYIERCVRSVLEQTYQQIEIILVDDCGSDASIPRAESILSTTDHNWRTVRHEHNRGLSAARNTGVASAEGKYIYFLDSDDYIMPYCIEKLLTALEESGASMAFGSYFWPSKESDLNQPYWQIVPERLKQISAFEAYMREATYATAHNRLFLRDAYLSTGITFEEGILHEDDPWSFLLSLRMPNTCGIADKTYCYCERTDSIMSASTMTPRRIEGRYAGLRIFVAEHDVNEQCQIAEFYDWYQSRFISVLSAVLLGEQLPSGQRLNLFRGLFSSLYLWEKQAPKPNAALRLVKLLCRACGFKLALQLLRLSYENYYKIKGRRENE